VRVGVVGAGIIGSSVAYELASRGADVTLIDSRRHGDATGASAGMLAPYAEGHFAELLTLGACSLDAYDGFVTRVAADAGQAIEYRRCGTLQVATDRAQAAELSIIAARLAAGHVPHQHLDGQAARAIEPALTGDVVAALRVASHGYVHVDQLVAALHSALTRRGGAFLNSGVASIVESRDAIRLAGDVAFPAFDSVVLAAGSWSSQVRTAAAAIQVKPIRGQRITLRCPAPPITQIVWGPGCYLVPWLDGRVIVGATVEDVGFNDQPTTEGVRGLLGAAGALVPALAEAEFEGVRVGLRPLAAGELPVIGRSSTMPRMLYATGHYRNGVLLAPLTATLIADELLGGREHPDAAAVRPARLGL
jgi:glycine oxidase